MAKCKKAPKNLQKIKKTQKTDKKKPENSTF